MIVYLLQVREECSALYEMKMKKGLVSFMKCKMKKEVWRCTPPFTSVQLASQFKKDIVKLESKEGNEDSERSGDQVL